MQQLCGLGDVLHMQCSTCMYVTLCAYGYTCMRGMWRQRHLLMRIMHASICLCAGMYARVRVGLDVDAEAIPGALNCLRNILYKKHVCMNTYMYM